MVSCEMKPLNCPAVVCIRPFVYSGSEIENHEVSDWNPSLASRGLVLKHLLPLSLA